jgi:putative sigma-54 modulation protein
MKLQIHSVHFDADQKLIDFIQKKTDKLETFFDRIIDGEVYLRLMNDNSNDNKIVEIKINIPGDQLFASEQAKTFEAATDSSVEALRRQLKKAKEKKYQSS